MRSRKYVTITSKTYTKLHLKMIIKIIKFLQTYISFFSIPLSNTVYKNFTHIHINMITQIVYIHHKNAQL
jgi:hypothetical protein